MIGNGKSEWRRLGLLLVLGVIATGSAQPQSAATVPVTVQVTDETGTMIPMAAVEADPISGAAGETVCTDRLGRAALNLARGQHELAIHAPGFITKNQQIDTTGAGTIAAVLSAPSYSGPVVVVETRTAGDSQTAEPKAGVSGNPVATATTLTITASPGQRGVFTPATLKDYPHQTVIIFNHHTNANETYSGVPLMDLLAKLGVPHGKDLHGKALADYVVATGSDGYKAVLALGEIDPEFHPGQVLVADQMDGKPLDAGTGPFRLIVTEDKRPARSVHSLISIELKTAEE